MNVPEIGGTVAHFQILERLGRGGMGVVYKARDLRLGRLVALKFMTAADEAAEAARRRFLREAQAASALDHPNVCTLFEIGETGDGRTFLAMAFCEGETLRSRLRRGPLDPREAVDIAIQVADGLAAAHALPGYVGSGAVPGDPRRHPAAASGFEPGDRAGTGESPGEVAETALPERRGDERGPPACHRGRARHLVERAP